MVRKPKVEFFDEFIYKKTKNRGRTTVEVWSRGLGATLKRRFGFRSYEKSASGGKTSSGARRRPYNRTIDLNDEERADIIAKKLWGIRKK